MIHIWKGFKETYNFFALNCSLHGITYTSSKWAMFYRLIWIIIICLGFCGSTYLSLALWFRFIDSPVRTSIVTQYAPISIIPFPAVTFCTPTIVKESNLKSFLGNLIHRPPGITDDQIKAMIPFILSTFPRGLNNFTALNMLSKILDENRYTVLSARDSLGQKCEELLVKCIWLDEEIDCMQVFEVVYTFQGRCCTFTGNGDENLYTEYYGFDMGLTIIMNTMENDAHTVINGGGVAVFVHQITEKPTVVSINNLALPGYETYISVEGQLIVTSANLLSLAVENRNCYFPGERKLRFYKIYEKQNCDVECYMNKSLELCNCAPYYFNVGCGYETCGLKKFPCILSVLVTYLDNTANEHKECNCLSPCDTLLYTSTMESSKLEGLQFVRKSFYSDFNLSESSMIANIGFQKQRAIIQKKDIVVYWLQILCNVGGVFGLFLGFSFITVFEILYIWISKFRRNCKKFRKNKMRK